MSDEPIQIARDLIDPLVERYNALLASMRTLDAQAEAQITRWQWASGEYYALRPLYHERYHVHHGQLLPDEPTKAGDTWLFGFDATDRLLAEYCYRVHEEPDDAEFMLYDAEGVEVIRYANTHFGTADSFLLITLGRLRGDLRQPEWYCEIQGGSPGIGIGQTDGSLSAMKGVLENLIPQNDWRVMFGGASVLYEKYRYEDNRLVEVQVQQRKGLDEDAAVQPQTHHISYAENGKANVQIDDPYIQSFETPPLKTNMDLAKLAEELGQTVIEAVRTGLDDLLGAYCWLEFTYDAVIDDGMMIYLGRELDRASFMESTYDRWFGSMQFHVRVEGRRYTEAISAEWAGGVSRYIEACRNYQDWKAVRTLFASAAKVLNAYDWRTFLGVTDDFIVFAYDHESTDDPELYILECVPESKIDLWRANGWFS